MKSNVYYLYILNHEYVIPKKPILLISGEYEDVKKVVKELEHDMHCSGALNREDYIGIFGIALFNDKKDYIEYERQIYEYKVGRELDRRALSSFLK